MSIFSGVRRSVSSSGRKPNRKMFEDDMIDQMFERHCRRQKDINAAFDKQILMC